MARDPKKKKLTVDQKRYTELVRDTVPRPRYIKNALLAYFFGGLIALIGQGFIDFYRSSMNLTVKEAANPAVATMIFIGALLTGLGVFDRIARVAGAGLAVPVTGFANSLASAALEFKREGLVFGVGSKMFILAGSVITFGVVTAFIIGLIYAIFIY